jgi:hypothetical protein
MTHIQIIRILCNYLFLFHYYRGLKILF